MDKTYKKEVAKILYMMAEMFRDKASEIMVEAWSHILSSEDISIEEARDTAITIMKNRKYNKLPTAAEFLDIVRPKENPKQLAEAQADEILDSVRRIGHRLTPNFRDPITRELMSTRWRWNSFCINLETKDVKWWRKDFVEAYIGKHESEERLKLQAPKPRALIGEEER